MRVYSCSQGGGGALAASKYQGSDDESVIGNSDDFSLCSQFLELPGATVGGMLGDGGHFRWQSSRCSWYTKPVVRDDRFGEEIGFLTDGAAVPLSTRKQGNPNGHDSWGRMSLFFALSWARG